MVCVLRKLMVFCRVVCVFGMFRWNWYLCGSVGLWGVG